MPCCRLAFISERSLGTCQMSLHKLGCWFGWALSVSSNYCSMAGVSHCEEYYGKRFWKQNLAAAAQGLARH